MAQMTSSSSQDSAMLKIEPFRGMDTASSPTQLDDHHSPDMLNLNIDNKGALQKRTGYEKLLDMGTGSIQGMAEYKTQFLLAHGAKLYQMEGKLVTWDMDDLTQSWEV
jgi:hypothetical protein